MRLSGRDKTAPVGVKPPAQAGEAIDGLRSALFRNDCLVQAFVLAEVADSASLGPAPDRCAVRPLPPVGGAAAGEAAAEMRQAREWLAGLEESNASGRESERREAEDKLAVLREEHRARVEDRRHIMEAQLMARLDAEHLAFK